MPGKCCVPKCTSNYDSKTGPSTSTSGYVSVFSFPKDEKMKQKWIKAIHRESFIPTKHSVVCIKHFSESCITRVDVMTRPDGSILEVSRKVPKLAKAAVPSIFPNQPSYLSKRSLKRKHPDERRQGLVNRDEANFQQWACKGSNVTEMSTVPSIPQDNFILSKKQTLFSCANPIESLRCLECVNFETHRLVDLTRHRKAGHTLPEFVEAKLYECESCTFQTRSDLLFLGHQSSDLCQRMQKIKFEEIIPEETEELQCGEKNETDPLSLKWFKCHECSYETLGPSLLQIHMSSRHSRSEECTRDKIQWFECAHCPYKSTRKSGLKSHMDCKHGNKTYMACDHCAFQTRHKHSLKDHILSKHTESDKIRWFKCAQCSFCSKRNSNLKCHVDRMHGERRRLKCENCAFSTKYEQTLKNHVAKKHTD